MRESEFKTDALVLVAHGVADQTSSLAAVRKHAAELRRRGVFREVVEAFWKAEPTLDTVWQRVTAARVFVVPMFMSAGHLTGEVIPAALGLVGGATAHQVGRWRVYYCEPVGTHPAMAEVALNRAAEVVAKHPFPSFPKLAETSLFLAGHGSKRNGNSRKSVEQLVGIIRSRNLYAAVHAVFLEEEPGIGEVFELAATRNVVLVPCFMGDGRHVLADIPTLLGESARVVEARLEKGLPTWRNPSERRDRRVWYAESVGSEPSLVEVILERVRESAAAREPDTQ